MESVHMTRMGFRFLVGYLLLQFATVFHIKDTVLVSVNAATSVLWAVPVRVSICGGWRFYLGPSLQRPY